MNETDCTCMVEANLATNEPCPVHPVKGVEEGFAGDNICETCEGTGEVEDRICKDCGGKVYR